MKFGFESYLLVALCAFSSVSHAYPTVTTMKVAEPRSAAAFGKTNFIGWVTNMIGGGFVKGINVIVPTADFLNDTVSINLDIANPTPFPMVIDRIVAKLGLNGTIQATFNQSFPLEFHVDPVEIKSKTVVNSGTFGNVTLPQGAEQAKKMAPLKTLDILEADVEIRLFTWFSFLGGFPMTIRGYKQENITTTYTYTPSLVEIDPTSG